MAFTRRRPGLACGSQLLNVPTHPAPAPGTQENVLLHSGEKTPNSPNFTHDELFTVKPVPAYVLPGYEEPLGEQEPAHPPVAALLGKGRLLSKKRV